MSTVLIVDDMAICREPIAEALRQHGYDAICAADGDEALSILQTQRPDLVLLDVNMPKLDGMAVLRTIRRNPDLMHIPVVLLTDCAEKDTVRKAAKRGVQGYLLKSSFSLAELLARVESGLREVASASPTIAGPPTSAGPPTDASPPPTKEGGGYSDWRTRTEQQPAAASSGSCSPRPSAAPAHAQAPAGSNAVATREKVRATVRSINDLTPVITRDDLMKLVNDGLALRPLGSTVHNVIAVTGSAGCSAEDVAKAVSHDQALCIRLLKLANTSAYSRGHLVDSLKEAIRRIGIQEVRTLVMTLGVFEQFEGAAAEHVDPQLFWEHSIACGLMASALAKTRQVKNVDDYFLWGMLHDVGRMILVEHASDPYANVWDVAEKLSLPLEAVEARLMLLDHCDILERALEHWQFPRDFIAPVVNHHRSVPNLKRLGPAHALAAAIVALADRIIHALLIGSSGNEVIYPLDDLVEFLGLPPAETAGLIAEVPDETNNLKCAMLARSNENAWLDFASQVKSRMTVELRPRCVSSEPALDAYRMFCERIATPRDGSSANLNVIYLRDAGEFLTLTAKLDAASQSGTAANTPVVLIVAKGKLDTNHPWLASRRHAVLPAPVRIPDFVSRIQQLLA